MEEIARRSGRPLTFVQIGSCDGKTNDPLHGVVRSSQWSGILVEPMPWLFEQLVANYEGVPGLRFFQVAIGRGEGPMTMYSVDPRPETPRVGQLTSFDRDVVLSHLYDLPELESRIFTVEVGPDCGIADRRSGPYQGRLPHIDAEGFDDQIIRDLPLTAPWAPQFLIFEKKHLSRTRYTDLRKLLASGVHAVNLWPDELAYRDLPDGLVRRP